MYDTHLTIWVAIGLAIIGILLAFWAGIRALRKGRTLKFFRMRRDHMVRGWRLLFTSVFLLFLAVFLYFYGFKIIDTIIEPTPTWTLTPTVTLTPTITQTPTISLTPTITPTPAVTDTPTASATPHIPLAVESQFESTITPNPESIISPLVFAKGIDEEYNPVDPGTVFKNPVGHLYAIFTYNNMENGSQWTALWYRNSSELVHYETKPWDGGYGGYGNTDWNPPHEDWLPGEYEVQIFVGQRWIVSGPFTVEGEAPTPMPSSTPTRTPTSSQTPAPSRTPTQTRTPTPTRTSTHTPGPSPTRQPSLTPTPRPPTSTPTITNTRAPTFTPSPPGPTNTRAPTATELLP